MNYDKEIPLRPLYYLTDEIWGGVWGGVWGEYFFAPLYGFVQYKQHHYLLVKKHKMK